MKKELLTKLQQITGPSRTVLLLSGHHCSPRKSWCLCWYQSFSRHYQRILSLGIDFPIHSLGQQNKSFLSNAEKMPSRLPSCNLLGLGGWISLGSVWTWSLFYFPIERLVTWAALKKRLMTDLGNSSFGFPLDSRWWDHYYVVYSSCGIGLAEPHKKRSKQFAWDWEIFMILGALSTSKNRSPFLIINVFECIIVYITVCTNMVSRSEVAWTFSDAIHCSEVRIEFDHSGLASRSPADRESDGLSKCWSGPLAAECSGAWAVASYHQSGWGRL